MTHTKMILNKIIIPLTRKVKRYTRFVQTPGEHKSLAGGETIS